MAALQENMVIFAGYIGRTPEIKEVNGTKLAVVNVASTRTWKDKDGNKKDDTTWMQVNVWGKQAEIIERFFDKGTGIYVKGSIEVREWEDNEGNKRYSTSIRANEIKFNGSKSDSSSSTSNIPTAQVEEVSNNGSDSLPF